MDMHTALGFELGRVVDGFDGPPQSNPAGITCRIKKEPLLLCDRLISAFAAF
jgi:hypothetical protein